LNTIDAQHVRICNHAHDSTAFMRFRDQTRALRAI
jgi:hypothetical protein